MIELKQLANPHGAEEYLMRYSSKALLLLHAFPLSLQMWAEAAPLLAKRLPDTVILALNVPGFGGTTARRWSMGGIAKEIYEALETNGISRVALCGVSMGGYIALAFYREYPEAVSAMIFCDTKSEADTEEAKKARTEFARDARERGPQAAIDRQFSQLLAPSGYSSARSEQLRLMIVSASGEALSEALDAMRGRADSTALLPIINVPTLVLRGSEDAIMERSIVEGMAQQIPNARYAEIEGTGHLPPFESPEVFAALAAEFLSSL